MPYILTLTGVSIEVALTYKASRPGQLPLGQTLVVCDGVSRAGGPKRASYDALRPFY